jgi:hypothetical protein
MITASSDQHESGVGGDRRGCPAVASYPAALEAFEDLAHGDALGVLDRAPTPEQGTHLSLPAIRSALKRGGRQRNVDARAREIQALLRSEQLAAPSPIAAAFEATTRAAVGIIAELNRQISQLETTLADHFDTPGRRHLPLPAKAWCRTRRPGAR